MCPALNPHYIGPGLMMMYWSVWVHKYLQGFIYKIQFSVVTIWFWSVVQYLTYLSL